MILSFSFVLSFGFSLPRAEIGKNESGKMVQPEIPIQYVAG